MAQEKQNPQTSDSPDEPPAKSGDARAKGDDASYELNPTAHGGEDLPDQPRSISVDHPAPGTSPELMKSKSFVEPPRREGRLSTWLLLLLTMIAALPATVSEIHRLDVNDQAEARAVLTSIETARRRNVLASASVLRTEQLVPHLYNQPRYDTPPGLHWLHMIAFIPLNVENAVADQLIFSARLAGVVMAMLAVAAVFWIGHSIGRTQTACFAALIFASNPLFVYHARLATADTAHLAWSLLSIAGGLWAIRPLRPLPSTERQFIGWITCGLAFGAATLTAGPITLVTVITPIFIAILLCPDRISHLIGLLAALLIGVLSVMPWMLYAHEHDPHAWETWLTSILPTQAVSFESIKQQAHLHALIALVGFVPWTLWLVAAIFQPFSKSSGGKRVNLFIGWTWLLVLSLLILPMPTENSTGMVLPLVAAASVLVGQCFFHFSEMASAGRYVRSWRWMRWLHLLLITLITGALPTLIYIQPFMIERNWIMQEYIANPGVVFICGFAAAMLLIVLLSLHGVLKHFPARAVVCWAIWAIVLMAVLAIPLARSSQFQSPEKEDAARIRQLIAGADAYWLQRDISRTEPNPIIALYAGRIMQWLHHSQVLQSVEHLHASNADNDLILISDEKLSPPGDIFKLSATLNEAGLRLWRYHPTPAQTQEATDATGTENP